MQKQQKKRLKKWEQMRRAGDPGWYQAYLRSDHWKKLRKRVLQKARYTCQRCGYVDRYQDKRPGYRLQVHHRVYAPGAERDEDLMALC